MKNMLKIIIAIMLVSILMLNACTTAPISNEEELSDIDKEIEALQQELLKQQDDNSEVIIEEMELEKVVEEETEVISEEIEIKEEPATNLDVKKLTVKETETVSLVLDSLDLMSRLHSTK